MLAAQGAFRLGIFSSATERTVAAVVPMLEAAAAAVGGAGAQLFADQRLVLPPVRYLVPMAAQGGACVTWSSLRLAWRSCKRTSALPGTAQPLTVCCALSGAAPRAHGRGAGRA